MRSGNTAAGRQGALGALRSGGLEHLPPLAAAQENLRAPPTHGMSSAHLAHQRLVVGRVIQGLPGRRQEACSPLPLRHRLPADRGGHLPVLP
jgi:hypothetical protein